ncbi:MAG: hypothetical protein P9L99_16930 [Candidatus Lernaella stagnicola]|nr:hypothetical protein [Candidatus Lernaella stagnicola]
MIRLMRSLDTPNIALWICMATAAVVIGRYFLARYKKPRWPATVALVLIALFVYGTQVHVRLTRYLERGSYGTFHYFIGSKYFDELGYFSLYRMTLLVDDQGSQRLKGHVRRIRNLEDYSWQKYDHALNEARREGPQIFTPERWQEFRSDVGPMLRQTDVDTWNKLLTDHGFNPAPFWNVLPGAVAQHIEVKNRKAHTYWRVVDVLMFVLVLIALAVLCGLDSALLIFIFTNVNWYYPSHFHPTFFQFMWLHTLILAMVFYRRNRMATSGAFFALSAALRIFPMVFLAGPGIIWLRRIWKERKLPRKQTFFLASFTITFVLAGLLGLTQGKGLQSTVQFAKNITMHAEEIRFAANKFGLTRLMCIDSADPGNHIRVPEREKNYANRPVSSRALWLLLVGLALAAMWIKIDDDHWVVPLGNVLIFALMVTSRYYYLMLVVFLIPGRDRQAHWFATISAAWIFFMHGLMFPLAKFNDWLAFTWGNFGFFLMFVGLPAALLIYRYREKRRETELAVSDAAHSDANDASLEQSPAALE